eukprot:2175554-Prymnesium_polylepis.1
MPRSKEDCQPVSTNGHPHIASPGIAYAAAMRDGFHRSAYENAHTNASRKIGYDTQQNGMGGILKHDPAPPTVPPVMRSGRGMAGVLGGGAPAAPEFGQGTGRRAVGPAAGSATLSEMDQLMHGVPPSDAPRRKQPAAAAGGAMHELLYRAEARAETVEADDPFAHCRASRKP